MNKISPLSGIWYAALAYIIWGFLPLYWKPLQHVGSGEILAHRIIWSFMFMMSVIAITGRWRQFTAGMSELFSSKKNFLYVFAASVLISANWLIYIWAVNTDHVVQASLGYYINPLVSVLLGVIVLKEKLDMWQIISFILAGAGVLFLTYQFGSFPWVSLSLAISFGVYGLAKKMANYDSVLGLAYETMLVAPFALLYAIFNAVNGDQPVMGGSASSFILLLGAGIVTAVPLLCFAQAARKISLTMIGFMQYIAPSLMLILGVLLYHESFSHTHAVAFTLIWTALFIFSVSRITKHTRLKKLNKEKAAKVS
ncbi:EamA family transporter RarD [Fictibacillus aquaticus]|uniref:Protein RarD n=1 Tax=Fictibacillus aquaticus TaxID=2021314 RepID=A0A235FBP8_9BACL|nr:EamA family transporter RarD [Fictibacillus aquaticus]OYD58652.1 protein RarD [Fictibacillus aquaticus]